MPPLPLGLQAYHARSLPFAAQQMVNWFVEPGTAGSKAPLVYYNAPGIKAFGEGGLAGAVRGARVMNDVLYIVAGNTVYSVASDGTATSLGTINTHFSRVGMEVNRADPKELIIVDGVDGWTYDTTNGLVEITDGDFLAANTVAFIDGYFILSAADGSLFFLSELDNGQSYIATDRADAEGDPDDIVSVFANHRELWVFGKETAEIFYNSGNTDFPFERIGGAFIERGLGAAFSVAGDDNTLFWLGDDKIVYRAAGYTPQRISTHAIEEEIRTYADVSDAFAFFVTISGHKFYHLTFPSGGRTFVYDAGTQLWHERKSKDRSHWRVGAYANAYGKHIIGDFFQGRLGELDMDTFSEFGETMQGILTSVPVHEDRKRVFHRGIELDIEGGVGTTGGGEPELWLDWSDDGGHTWSLRKPPRSMGAKGKYRQRLRWNRLGSARERIYRVTVSAAVKRSIVAAHINKGAGAH